MMMEFFFIAKPRNSLLFKNTLVSSTSLRRHLFWWTRCAASGGASALQPKCMIDTESRVFNFQGRVDSGIFFSEYPILYPLPLVNVRA